MYISIMYVYVFARVRMYIRVYTCMYMYISISISIRHSTIVCPIHKILFRNLPRSRPLTYFCTHTKCNTRFSSLIELYTKRWTANHFFSKETFMPVVLRRLLTNTFNRHTHRDTWIKQSQSALLLLRVNSSLHLFLRTTSYHYNESFDELFCYIWLNSVYRSNERCAEGTGKESGEE